jgi:predicted ATPase
MTNFDDFVLEPVKKPELNDEVVRLRWRQKGSSYLFQPWQMSEGSLRFLALAVVLSQPKPPPVIIIDEPELGLHREALDTLAGMLHLAAYDSQVIVATQSPDLLSSLEPDNVITVEMIEGKSQFKRLKREELAIWLNEYNLADLWWKNII